MKFINEIILLIDLNKIVIEVILS